MAEKKAVKEKEKKAGKAEPKPPKGVSAKRQSDSKPAAKAGKPLERRKEPKPSKRQEKPSEEPRPEEKPTKPKPSYPGKILTFGRWDTSEVTVEDPGLAGYINLDPIVVPRTSGKFSNTPFHKEKVNITERFMNRLMVPGHRGKKHKLTSGHCVGNTVGLYNDMKEALEIIEKKTGKNPFQVLVVAIENSSLLEEVASYRLGGIIARQAVLVSPQRRLDLALRHLTQGIYRTSFRSRQSLAGVIADELIAASNNDPKSFAVSERNRMEKEAEGAR